MPDPEFFQELKDQYSRLLENRTNLDSKANNVITMSGTIVTLLMGFGLFIIKSIKLEYAYLYHAIFFLISGIVLLIAGIIFSTLAYRIQPMSFPLGHKAFFTCNEYDSKKTEDFRNAEDDVFYKRMIEEYLVSIKENTEINASKAIKIKISHWLFVSGIITIPIIVAILIHAMLTSNMIAGNI